jgi:acetoacetyl-CoA synthetase
MHVAEKVQEGELLWTPRPEFVRDSNVSLYLGWLRQHGGPDLADYDALWRWSVAGPEAFWASQWQYFKVESATPYRQVLDRRTMPGAKWFEGSRVSVRCWNAASSGPAVRSWRSRCSA